MILLDTHAWIWLVGDPDKLSQKARDKIEKAKKESEILISCISSWEIAMLVAKNRLRLTMAPMDWIAYCERLPFFKFIPIDNDIAVKSVDLPEFSYGDPADRIIVATAMSVGATLITKDRKILDYAGVETFW